MTNPFITRNPHHQKQATYKMATVTLKPASWQVNHSPSLPGSSHMKIDKDYLLSQTNSTEFEPKLRFFQWMRPTISYGYLQNGELVQRWAENKGNVEIVQRPTGGGVVFHQPTDLSLSLIWPREKGIFPENPRDCYKAIHMIIKKGIEETIGLPSLSLFSPESGPCDASPEIETCDRFSLCFQAPICHDVMQEGQKIVGGALRLTRKAILYQGNILNPEAKNLDKCKSSIISSLGQI
ncbi:hypothetical protein BVX98_06850 [bacterium F11]|nr:hypothetical protein BVX98_06850 [bacterium F11]